MHYYRVKRGKPLLEPTRFTRRPAIIDGDVAKLPLAGGKEYALVDVVDSKVDQYQWSKSTKGYGQARVNGKLVLLHHYLLGKPPEGMVTDHINRNKLDNRKGNLRFVTQKVNMNNLNMLSTNTSGHTGVTWAKNERKWVAQSFFNGKRQHGGYHVTIEEAVRARKVLELKYKQGE